MTAARAEQLAAQTAPPAEARRIIFTAVRKAEWERVPLPAPDALGPTQVLLRTECSVVSAGTETANYAGTHIDFQQPGRRVPIPFRPGYALAGRVVAVGSGVEDLKPGDRVAASTNHADWAVIDTTRTRMVKLPDGVTGEQGCLARLSAIAFQGVRLARVALGERVAVFGQGLIGQFARQYSAIDGAVMTMGVDLVDARLEVSRKHGATHTLNPSRDDVRAAIKEATGGEGVEVAIEATGHPPVINDALKVAGFMGRVVLLGSPRGRIEIDPYTDIHHKGVVVIGAHARTSADPPNAYHRWSFNEHFRLGVELIRQGRLHTDGLITRRVPASEALGVHEAIVEHPQDHLGVVIQWAAEA